MASRKIERTHSDQLKKLLADTGIVCLRPPGSLESETLSEEMAQEEEEYRPEGKEEELEEEILPPPSEKEESEQFDVFPTPSLRLMLPSRVREIEKYNRVHVLPLEFNKDIDPEMIPIISKTARQVYIDQLADITGCTRYKSSLPEYWFLDTLANMLRRGQEENIDKRTQALLILWFCEWMREMQYFDAADRPRMLKRFKDNMLRISRYIAVEEVVPTPDEVGIFHNLNPPEDPAYVQKILPFSAQPSTPKLGGGKGSVQSKSSKSTPERKSSREIKLPSVHMSPEFMCSLQDLSLIFHYIYDLFSTDYQFDLIRSIFTFTPDYTLIDCPYQILSPKRLYEIPKPQKEKKKPKPKTPGGRKGKNLEPLPEDYIHLMELKEKEEEELEEKEYQERLEWLKKSSILPLTLAATPELFDRYWPPPEPEPEPVVVQHKKK